MTRIAVVGGDGVGPEVIEQAERVLDHIAVADPAVEFDIERFGWGTDFYRETGEMMPPDGVEVLAGFDSILFGAVGSPDVDDDITLRGLVLAMRLGLDQYVNFRPVRLFPGVPSPLRNGRPDTIDMLFVREGSEGEYAGLGDRIRRGSADEAALQTSLFSRRGIERVVRWAFELAVREERSVTSVSKANALQYSGVLWDEVVRDVATEYPTVETHHLLVDAAAMFMVQQPERFGVVVASNLFGDILTDLGAGIMGGMGLAPSASMNPERRFPSMFEPIHGSAPDIAGQGRANPIGAIWSTALMLADLGLHRWYRAIMSAIEATVADPRTRTADLAGTASTAEVGDAILAHLGRVEVDTT